MTKLNERDSKRREDYSYVDILGARYKIVNFRKKCTWDSATASDTSSATR